MTHILLKVTEKKNKVNILPQELHIYKQTYVVKITHAK